MCRKSIRWTIHQVSQFRKDVILNLSWCWLHIVFFFFIRWTFSDNPMEFRYWDGMFLQTFRLLNMIISRCLFVPIEEFHQYLNSYFPQIL
ncbi:hypothetical protein GLOIN_2v1639796 [Rhizophagus irregularis DAOM 181602=DAOM 197198]|uniref:Uncharacterized protein n=1 Tax=Rhizophagus irregularis (strain DAOM 181602 / DAOM 197198 / MUCL 43194) TaxID=747089 RepID=A0A2P4PS00_RHIID|nr:hypothetical protein GLOIN_2v1639796 [Rhizophagus irregularis DAOM 181602=DAOM 197198]POG68164.1 hypothetical protein GLOIN_2v1639796 [Rhizophagus irregularis DAOM 181602=DAOM 197198]|eukprot:XP_025175030.1 hypothetical protein GLOIN_2v1639796 [Rhizophagus irregularis DAOM 181602=DAOM 197198]